MKNKILHDFNRLERSGSRRRPPQPAATDPEVAVFLGRWLKAPHRIGALAPSSRYLARAMARQIDPRHARLVIELGGGTGSITRALLAAGLPAEKLIVVERDERLHRLLAERFPQLRVLHGDAAQLVQMLRPLGIATVSAIISSLPLLSMPKRLRHRIVEQSFALLGERGSLVQFTYGIASPLPEREFPVAGKVMGLVWRNIPPAFVWRFQRRAAAMARVA
jgi:phosphatidylethanolamine/phosphatidyl-N-methylethanolamine N-methyltransferase